MAARQTIIPLLGLDDNKLLGQFADVDPAVGAFFLEIKRAVTKDATLVAKIKGSILFLIGDVPVFLDLRTEPGSLGRATSVRVAPTADLTITYKHVQDFVSVQNGQLSYVKALYQKRLVVQGSADMVKRVRALMEAAKPPPAAKRSMTLRPAPMSAWMNDAECSSCQQCKEVFTFFMRRHHCRFCGRIFCQSCSSREVQGMRICDPCFESAYPKGSHPPPEAGPVTRARSTSAASVAIVEDLTMGEATAPDVEPEDPEKETSSARIRMLERKVQALEAELLSVSRSAMPGPLDMMSHSELIAGLVYPPLTILAFIGWRTVPLLVFLFACNALFFGSWFGTIFWFALFAWMVFVARSPKMALFRRRLRVYGIAFVALCDYKITGLRAKSVDAGEADVLWELTHRRTAARAYQGIAQLRGMWVKTGQYLSSRADVMPQPYITCMSKLQDALPPRPITEVRATIEEDLGRPMNQVFSQFDEECLAAASVAQVHRAVLADGTVVAVKIQHRGMDTMLHQDLLNLGSIMSWVSWAEPSLDINSVLAEWSKEVVKELDFVNEADNMTKVRRNMVAAKMPVVLPEVIPGMATHRVLVMRFVEGVKVSDVGALDRLGVDKDKLVDDICTAYAHQIYCDGFFNGDPHPGNIMIVRRSALQNGPAGLQPISHPGLGRGGRIEGLADENDSWVPVLLDFGLTKQLTPSIRLAFAKMVACAETMDFGGVLEAFAEMGLQLGANDATADIENIQFMFRDAAPADEARARHAEYQKKQQAREATQTDEEKRANRVQSWPKELIFFMRTSELLQGLASHLGTRYPYMRTMSRAARRAMRENVPVRERARFPVYPALPGTDANLPALDKLLRRQLGSMRTSGKLLGMQVCVIADNQLVVDVAAGELGPLNTRPVTPDSLFPLFGVSRFVAICLVHALALERRLSYDQRISDLWPEFSAAGKSNVTIADLLRCRSGVEGAVPEQVSLGSLNKWEQMLASVAAAPSRVLPAILQHEVKGDPLGDNAGLPRKLEPAAHLYFGWGWAIGGLLNKVSGSGLQQALTDLITRDLGIGDEIRFSIPVDYAACDSRVASVRLRGKQQAPANASSDSIVSGVEPPAVASADADSSAASGAAFGSSQFSALRRRNTSTSGSVNTPSRSAVNLLKGSAAAGAPAPPTPMLAPSVSINEEKSSTTSDGEDADPEDEAMVTAMAALELAEVMTDAGLEELEGLRGKEAMMDPRLYNSKAFRAACLPSSNVMASARGMARLGAWLCDHPEVGSASGSAYGLGFRSVTFQRSDGQVTHSAFGHTTLGGTLCICDPATRVSIAITVNELSTDRFAALQVARVLCDQLGLGIPLNL